MISLLIDPTVTRVGWTIVVTNKPSPLAVFCEQVLQHEADWCSRRLHPAGDR